MKTTYLKQFAALLMAGAICSCSNDFEPVSEDAATSQDTTKVTTKAFLSLPISYTDESSFVNSLSSYGFLEPDDINLNRSGTKSGYNSVYGFNIPSANQVTGFKWNSGDEDTEEWRPQGLTGFNWGGRKFLLATWYGVGPGTISGVYNQHKGVRVALVDITDMNNITYRHILLVQDKNNMNNSNLYRSTNSYDQLDLFCPVTIHAGGVAYSNNKIYVVDTKLGMRVFDIRKLIAVSGDSTKSRIGRETDGTLKAFNYSYVLPQIGYYDIDNANPYSCISLGTGNNGEARLWTGQYLTPDDNQTPKIYGFALNSNGQINTGQSVQQLEPQDNATGNNGPVYRVQGVYRKGQASTSLVTTTGNSSYEGSTARLVRHYSGDGAGTRFRWPHGAEDLYYDSSTGYLWNLTEYESSKYGQDNRCVFAVRYSDYD
ncbi:hypothetical protein GN157_07430 [Flavobacterium rakeshii]|uniref:DUF4374 domain-containing protein n=1 Tax=Flavobacterium rakeshii TaxID=1038845 RepID=A0A6N8HEG7_9FLAO|nr:hypothetical protein [Flavobacterium rakeshii]MUV03538.1 hypothetical protein [Flavobacterium rakeshii]